MTDIKTNKPDKRYSVAPMMDWTDRHCRYFMRLLSPNAWLYTEMVTANAIHYGDAESLLRYDASEHPVAVQPGSSAECHGIRFGCTNYEIMRPVNQDLC